jgi:uncharacterized protein
MNENLNPIQDQNRIVIIDILRGIAILGIFIVNMPAFHSPMLYYNSLEWWDDNPDHTLYILSDIFAQASFYPMFAFLFGFGAVILSERVIERGQSFPLIFSKRLATLLLFGCLHAFLIWHGDILINYALFGFGFLLFYKVSGKNLLIIGSLLYIIPLCVFGLLVLAAGFLGMETKIPTEFAEVQRSLNVYKDGTISEIIKQRASDWYMVNNAASLIFLFLSIFPLFLIGAGFAKLKWLENPEYHKKPLFLLMIISLVFGLFCKVLPYVSSYTYNTVFWQDQFGGPLLSLFYITAISLLLRKKTFFRMCLPFSYPGRLSMTNYLFQSFISTLIFYSYGLGFYGDISFTWGTGLVIIIFILQVILSKLWLSRYRLGPVEFVWRILTYGKISAMKR